jgi:hypothetical protein
VGLQPSLFLNLRRSIAAHGKVMTFTYSRLHDLIRRLSNLAQAIDTIMMSGIGSTDSFSELLGLKHNGNVKNSRDKESFVRLWQ